MPCSDAQLVELKWGISLCSAFNRFNDMLQVEIDGPGGDNAEQQQIDLIISGAAIEELNLAVRLGAHQSPESVAAATQEVQQASDLQPNALAQHVAWHYLHLNRLTDHVALVRGLYAERYDALVTILTKAGFTVPAVAGGMFIFPILPVDTGNSELSGRAVAQNVLFAPGPAFRAQPDSRLFADCMRLCFRRSSQSGHRDCRGAASGGGAGMIRTIFIALIPIVLLIGLGHVMKQRQFLAASFWRQAERLSYFVLLPALFTSGLATADHFVLWSSVDGNSSIEQISPPLKSYSVCAGCSCKYGRS